MTLRRHPRRDRRTRRSSACPRMSPKPGVRLWAKLEGNNPTGLHEGPHRQEDGRDGRGVRRAHRRQDDPGADVRATPASRSPWSPRARATGSPSSSPTTPARSASGCCELFGAEIVFSDGDKGTNGSIEVARRAGAGRRSTSCRSSTGTRRTRSRTTRGPAAEIVRGPSRDHALRRRAWAPAGRSPGNGRRLHEHDPNVKVIAAEPELGDLVYGLRSLDEGFVPPIFDPDQVDRKFLVNSADALRDQPRAHGERRASSPASRRGAVVHVAQRIAAELDDGRHRVSAPRRRLEVPVDRGVGRGHRDGREGRRGVAVVVDPRVSDPRPIGVFDSGVGGLTVARAILDLLPHEPMIYVGDRARFPYGPRPLEEIRRFAIEIAEYLVAPGREDARGRVQLGRGRAPSATSRPRAGIPVVGVIDPGVRAAVHATRNGVIGLIGTEATVDERRVRSGRSAATGAGGHAAFRRPARCSSSTSSAATPRATRCGAPRAEYLAPLMERGIDTLILGCTHYPLLSGLLQLELGPDVVLVSSAEETAKDVYATLLRSRAASGRRTSRRSTSSSRPGDPALFQRLAEVFLGPELVEVRAAQAQPVGRRRVELTVLGSQRHVARPGRRDVRLPPAATTGTHVWLDAGTGTFSRLQEYVGVDEMTGIVITHGHPDHFVGHADPVLLRAPLRRARAARAARSTRRPRLHRQGGAARRRETGRRSCARTTTSRRVHDGDEFSGRAVRDHGVRDGAHRRAGARLPHRGRRGGARVHGRHRSVRTTWWSWLATPTCSCPRRPIRTSNTTVPVPLRARRQAGEHAAKAGAKRLMLTHICPTLDPAVSRRGGDRPSSTGRCSRPPT